RKTLTAQRIATACSGETHVAERRSLSRLALCAGQSRRLLSLRPARSLPNGWVRRGRKEGADRAQAFDRKANGIMTSKQIKLKLAAILCMLPLLALVVLNSRTVPTSTAQEFDAAAVFKANCT